MKTERLYDKSSKIKEFDATVLSCTKENGVYRIILDKTAFFPEAGGQPCDKGTVNGINVLDVKIENDIIIHYLSEELSEGENVSGKIDFKRRFSFMQNHSAEHIISGIVNRKYGYDNVGFHLNEEFVTLDFDGLLSKAQIDEIEYLANEVVWKNVNIKAYYPTEQELKNTDFRQKKEIEGDIRLVEIEGTDICACCAPHVEKTGEIGLIKLLGCEKMRGGIRLYMKAGGYALTDYNDKFNNITEIQNLLSVKPDETAQAVIDLNNRLNDEKQKIKELKIRITDIIASSDTDSKFIFADDFEMRDLQILADKRFKNTGKTAFVLSKQGNYSFAFTVCGNEDETNALMTKLRERLNIRGGGRNGMISGSINGEENRLKEILNELD